jgi:hypothetical protein
MSKSANGGYPFAAMDLAEMYKAGEGVTQDYLEAAKWYRRAADDGYPLAQLHLGEMYRDGLGVPQNNVLAHMWFNVASAGPFQNGRRERDSLAKQITPEQITEAQRLAREWRRKNSC